jgi:hypothetical protein
MAQEGDDKEQGLRGEAAWKAGLNATEQRNNAARAKAHAHQSATSQAIAKREHRMAQLESAQLANLNKKLDKR